MTCGEDRAEPCEVYLRESGLHRDPTIKALVQSLPSAIPRLLVKGRFLRMEAEVLK